jgi:hypothetical protein
MRNRLKELYWAVTTQFGVQPTLTLRALRALPWFVSDFWKFRKNYSGPMQLMPFLHDRQEQGGDIRSEYFLQDLNVAKRIFERNPLKHVDVGSRVDGFVAHIASFRKIEIIDIRPILGEVAGIEFTQADLMNIETSPSDYCDSLSCLHALEHFGLGRYGDKVDPLGWKAGFQSLSRILKRGGTLYLSVPVGKERVVFNANRVFSPMQLVNTGKEFGLRLENLSWVTDGRFCVSSNSMVDIDSLSLRDYSLGIFEFIKE